MLKRKLIAIVLLILILVVSIFLLKDEIVRWWFTPQNQPVTDKQQEAEKTKENPSEQKIQTQEIPLITVIAENLEVPWDIDFLPTGDMLVTERHGSVIRIDKEGIQHRLYIEDEGVNIYEFIPDSNGEGGLLGIAIGEHGNQTYVFLYGVSEIVDGLPYYRVRKLIYDQKLDVFHKPVQEYKSGAIPGAKFHDGGALDFGPDGTLYLATGDATHPELAQDPQSPLGKIIRLRNPYLTAGWFTFNSEYLYSLGHRNPQGLAWDDQGRLWSTEHGRTTLTLTGLDELNLIEKGGNYGWPDSEGNTVLPGTIAPVLHSGPDITWAPASLAYLDGKLYWGGLRGETLYEYDIETKKLEEHFVQEFGRIRAVVVGPDNMLYISTSNRDGRGEVRKGDDKILKINPKLLQ